MGFYADIKQQYSSRVCQQLKLWANHNLKLASLRNRRIFLLECRRQGLTPRHIRDRIISLYGSISSSDSVRQAERMQAEYYYCKKFLKNQSSLLILQSDKGNVTVAMNREHYHSLVLEILSDEKYYRKVSRDPTSSFQTKANDMIKHFIRKEYISEQQGKTMFNYNAVPARFYGLPKVHKPILSLRPIISSINTPITKLSALTSQILSDSMDDNNSTPNQHTTDMQEGLIQNGMLGESREVSDVEADRVTTQQRDDSPTRNGMPGGTGELASLEETQQIATHEGEIASQEDLLDEAGEFTRINTGAHITPSNRDSLIRNGMPDETLETTTDEEERRLTFVAFPLIPQVTNSIIKLFRSDKLKIAVKNEFKIGNMFSHTKDKFSIEKTSNAVYKVPCAQCHLSYIGQTSQQIKKRMAQHKSDIKHPGKGCALAQHCHDNQHMMNFNNIQILEREKNYRKRTFLEMFHIKKNLENVVNSRSDIKNISSIYTFLIHHNKDHDRRRNNSTA